MVELSLPGHSILMGPYILKAVKSADSVMSHGTPPRNTLHERTAPRMMRWGSWPDQVHDAS